MPKSNTNHGPQVRVRLVLIPPTATQPQVGAKVTERQLKALKAADVATELAAKFPDVRLKIDVDPRTNTLLIKGPAPLVEQATYFIDRSEMTQRLEAAEFLSALALTQPARANTATAPKLSPTILIKSILALTPEEQIPKAYLPENPNTTKIIPIEDFQNNKTLRDFLDPKNTTLTIFSRPYILLANDQLGEVEVGQTLELPTAYHPDPADPANSLPTMTKFTFGTSLAVKAHATDLSSPIKLNVDFHFRSLRAFNWAPAPNTPANQRRQVAKLDINDTPITATLFLQPNASTLLVGPLYNGPDDPNTAATPSTAKPTRPRRLLLILIPTIDNP